MPTSALAKKLQIKRAQSVALVNAPSGTLAKLEPLPAGAKAMTKAPTADAVIALAKDQVELMKFAPTAIKTARPDGVTLVAVDETWSAMRFRTRGAAKRR